MMEKNQNSVTKEDKISKYETAPIAKRLFAGIMDAVVFVFVFFGLALWVFTPIANAGLGYNDTVNVGKRYHLSSHLYLPQKINDDGNVIIVEVKDSTGNMDDYTELPLYNSKSEDKDLYLKRIYYYYHNFKCNVDIELPQNKEYDVINDHFASPSYEKEINGVLPVNLYTNDWFLDEILDIDSEKSFFEINKESEDFISSIVIKESVSKEEAFNYLRNQAYEATKDFYYSDFFQAVEKRIEAIQYFIFLPPFALSFAIFYILIPLLFKDGETLGKKTMNIAVISYDGYSAKKRQILFREILLFIVISILGIVVGIGLTSFAIMALGVLVLFILTLISKKRRCLFDYAAYTIVVDSIHSVWFKTKEDELRHEQELKENMAKYTKYVPENKNLIQVGSTIVDENLKKEIEKEKSKKSSKK